MTRPADPAAPRRLPSGLASILLVLVALSAGAEVSLPGIAQANLEAAAKGRLLLEELNCVACHRAPEGTLTAAKQAPRLAYVARRGACFAPRLRGEPAESGLPGEVHPRPARDEAGHDLPERASDRLWLRGEPDAS